MRQPADRALAPAYCSSVHDDKPRYEDPPLVSQEYARRVLGQAIEGVNPNGIANSVLVGLAMKSHDREFVEAWCLRIGREAPDLWLRGLAAHCVGCLLAMRFGYVSPKAVLFVRELAAGQDVRNVNEQAVEALHDLELFYPASRSVRG